MKGRSRPEMKKNDVFTTEINALTNEGEGIGHSDDGMAFFIKGALPGDVVRCGVTKVKRTYGYARLIEVLNPSKDRIAPDCPIFGRCGGCVFRNYDYNAELEFKQKLVRDAIERIGGFSDIEILPIDGFSDSSRRAYRNKTEIPVKKLNDGRVAAGFYAGRTHSIIPLPENDCLLQPKEFADVTKAVLDWMNEKNIAPYDEVTGKGGVRHILIRKSFASGEILLCLVVNTDSVPELPDDNFESAGVTTLSINHNTKNTNVILGKKTEVISGQGFITERLGELSYRVSAPSFFQVNTVQAEKLYTFVKEFASLEGNEKVWDLYCGTGTIGLFLSHYCPDIRLMGIEAVPSAIEDAKNNAVLNMARNADFLCGKAEEIVPKLLSDNGAPDVVILDPPRKGCDVLCLDTVAKAAPGRIVYVSCNPATLARDMKYLKEIGGYEPVRVQPVDMFPGGGHVETVVSLSLKKDSPKIEVSMNPGEDSLYEPQDKGTCEKIKAYVLEKFGFKVSSLYIAQVKDKCGLDKRLNYNLSKKDDPHVPECPKEKEDAIMDAFRHFGLIE